VGSTKNVEAGIGISKVLREEGLNSFCASDISDTTGMGFIRGERLRRCRLEWSGEGKGRPGVLGFSIDVITLLRIESPESAVA
jgi:hypothetical protein